MVAGTAADEKKATAPTDFGNVILSTTKVFIAENNGKQKQTNLDASQNDRLVFKVDATTHSIDYRFRLFENFLLHERAVVACFFCKVLDLDQVQLSIKVIRVTLHDLLNLHLQCGNFTSVRVFEQTLETMDAKSSILDCGNIVVLWELTKRYFTRVLRRNIYTITSRKMTRLVCSIMAEASDAKKYSTSAFSALVWNSAVDSRRGRHGTSMPTGR